MARSEPAGTRRRDAVRPARAYHGPAHHHRRRDRRRPSRSAGGPGMSGSLSLPPPVRRAPSVTPGITSPSRGARPHEHGTWPCSAMPNSEPVMLSSTVRKVGAYFSPVTSRSPVVVKCHSADGAGVRIGAYAIRALETQPVPRTYLLTNSTGSARVASACSASSQPHSDDRVGAEPVGRVVPVPVPLAYHVQDRSRGRSPLQPRRVHPAVERQQGGVDFGPCAQPWRRPDERHLTASHARSTDRPPGQPARQRRPTPPA